MSGKAPDEQVRAREELRRSGASGTHGDRRLKRLRTKRASKQAAISEQRRE